MDTPDQVTRKKKNTTDKLQPATVKQEKAGGRRTGLVEIINLSVFPLKLCSD